MILVVDNYDSFVYNLVHYLELSGAEVVVMRNDDERLLTLSPSDFHAIVLSPGPCTPEKAGYSVEMLQNLKGAIPVLGVCLGHQCIGMAYEVTVIPSPTPVHGQAEKIFHQEHPLFEGLSNPFDAARYHSLMLPIEDEELGVLQCIARSADGLTMAVAHSSHPVLGVQFHPESILTPQGLRLIANFVKLAENFNSSKNPIHHE